MSRQLPRWRFAVQAFIDAASWIVGLYLATWLRFDLVWSKVEIGDVAVVAVAAAMLHVIIGRSIGLYVHRWRYGTFEEAVAAVEVTLLTAAVLTVINLLPALDRPVPISSTVVGGFLALFFMACGRFAWRVQIDRRSRVIDDGRVPTIVFGAGEAGLQVVQSMRRGGQYEPVAVLDDNPHLRNLTLKGVRVRGDRASLPAIARETGATTVVIAIPSAGSELVRELATRADEIGLRTLVLPPVDELFGSAGVGDIRPLTEADLLGRREIKLDIGSVADYITGKRVLVTGAGGSIGSELCRQLNRFAPESLVMLDRDESALQAVQVSIEGVGLLDSRELVVCCIRDQHRLRQVFEEHKPEVIFHAAALKHLPLLEMHPEEGWKTNVWGTSNLLELAGEFQVEQFVNISTDKAADPTSVLGQTKRLAEQLTSDAGNRHAGTYISVRFGNVLGSRGSVLPLFRAQIDNGGPVTVTHPDVTRYFMTIPEACELVIQAGALGSDGEVMVLDMGEPVRIADLAHRLIAESERPVEIVYTGLRPGEKLHEVLFAPDECSTVSEHPMIFRVEVPPLSADALSALDPFNGTSIDVIDLRIGSQAETARDASVTASRE